MHEGTVRNAMVGGLFALVCLSLIFSFRAFSKSEERIKTLRLIWEMRQASLHSTPTHIPAHSRSPPQPHTSLTPPTLPHGPKVETDNANSVWPGHDHRPPLIAPSPDRHHALHVTEEDRNLRYSSASTSSGSTISATGSPYTPSSLPANAPLYSHSHQHYPDPSSYSRPPGVEHPGEYPYYDHTVLQGMGQTPSTSRNYPYTGGLSSSMAPFDLQNLSTTPMTYTGTDGQLYIRSPPRMVSSMGQDYRQYPHYSYSS